MAKIKVYELAKEMGLESKDLLTALKNKGIEVKSHMSVLEDGQVDELKRTFKTPDKSAGTHKAAENKEAIIEKQEQVKPAKTAETPVKKKKSIIFVSNPNNSKMPGAQIPKKPAKPAVQPAAKKQESAPQVTDAPKEAVVANTAKPPVEEKIQPQAVEKTAAVQTQNDLGTVKATEPAPAAANTEKKEEPKQMVEENTVKPQIQESAAAQKEEAPKQTSSVTDSVESPRSNDGQRTYNNNNNGSRTNDGQRTYNNNGPRSNDGQRTYNNNGPRSNDGQRTYNNNGPRSNDGQRPYNNNGPRSNDGQRTYNNNGPRSNDGQRPYNNNGPRSNDGQRTYNNNGPRSNDGQRPYNNNGPRSNDGQRPYNNNGPRSNDGQRPYNNNGPRSNDGQRPYNNNGPRSNDGQRPYNNNGPRSNDGQRPAYNNNGPQNRNQGSRPGQGYQSRGGFDKDKDFDKNDRGRQGGGYGNRAGKPATGAKGFEAPIKETEKHRDEEKRRISQEKDRKSKKDLIYEEDGDLLKVKNKAGKFIKPEKRPEDQIEEQIKVITLPETLIIKELAEKMKIQPSAIVKKLFLQGQIVTVNQEITYEDAENIAIDYDIICEKEVKVDVIEELLKEEDEKEENLIARPPVICVMGHVDHGKTSLLDAIRKTNVTDKEAGGITQHIGAYTVTINEQKITFLDTPGHEAFTAMRMRGANSTDIAILVVAADDGVMPQTVEAINHAKAAGIEIIVAVNKIDKPGANVERVKQELTEYGLIAEDWGGETVFVPVSAKSGEGIETLLEMILLTAEVLELKANPDRQARGLVIEAQLDKGRGPVATVLVQKGTLHVGDFVSAGAASGKVRAMIDDKGRRVKEAGPSTPVEILGLGDVPNAGEIFLAHENDKEAKYYAETFVAQNKEKLLEDTKAKMSLDDLFTQIQAGNLKELDLIIKADVQGSVEAVKQSLLRLSNEEVVVKCIHGGVGAINESDVILASASNAIIIGFNVRPDVQAKVTAEREGVDMRLYKVIYQAIEDIEAAMKGMLDPVFEEKVIGHAEVRQIFKASSVGNIAGSYVLDGTFQRDCSVRVTRAGEQIFEGKLASLKRFKDDVKEVKTGFECGLLFDGFDQMQELDIVEAYIMVEVPR